MSLTGDAFSRMYNFANAFNNKFATVARQDLRNLGQEIVTSKNPAKVAKKLLQVAAGAGTVMGSTIALSLYRSGYGEPNMPVTPEAVGKTALKSASGLVAPYATRWAEGLSGLKESNPMNKATIIVNALAPTFGTQANVVGDIAQLAMQGTPQDIYNPEVNPSFRYMPPRLVTEPIYEQSSRYQEQKANKALAAGKQPYAEQKTQDDLTLRANTALMYSALLNQNDVKLLKERKPGTVGFNTALNNAEQTISNLKKYGTAEQAQIVPVQVDKFRRQADIAGQEAKAARLLREGKLTPEQWAALMMSYKDLKKGL